MQKKRAKLGTKQSSIKQMEKAKYFLWGLVGLTSIWSFVKMFGGHDEIGGIVKEKQLISEVTFAVSGIECGYPDAGYVYYTPTEAAENYISLINSIGSEADDLAKAAGRLPQKPLKHIIGLPDAPWEIVL